MLVDEASELLGYVYNFPAVLTAMTADEGKKISFLTATTTKSMPLWRWERLCLCI